MNNNSVIFTKKELWLNQAGCFGFQFNEDQLLRKALKAGFVTKVGEDQYLMNDDYQSLNDQCPIDALWYTPERISGNTSQTKDNNGERT